jgi:hypothetical protein
MPRCPWCDSTRIVIRVDRTREAFCVPCGTRWKEDGAARKHVRRPPLVASLERQPQVPPGPHGVEFIADEAG